jgi:hypothetical protein
MFAAGLDGPGLAGPQVDPATSEVLVLHRRIGLEEPNQVRERRPGRHGYRATPASSTTDTGTTLGTGPRTRLGSFTSRTSGVAVTAVGRDAGAGDRWRAVLVLGVGHRWRPHSTRWPDARDCPSPPRPKTRRAHSTPPGNRVIYACRRRTRPPGSSTSPLRRERRIGASGQHLNSLDQWLTA